jgi:Fungal protein kinase
MLHLWYYDRVGVVKSQHVDLVKNPLALVQFLTSISNLTDEVWGFHPVIQYPSTTMTPLNPSLHPHAPPNCTHSDNHTDTFSDNDGKECSTTDADYKPSLLHA